MTLGAAPGIRAADLKFPRMGLPGSVENFTSTDRVSLGLLDYVGYVSVKEFI